MIFIGEMMSCVEYKYFCLEFRVKKPVASLTATLVWTGLGLLLIQVPHSFGCPPLTREGH